MSVTFVASRNTEIRLYERAVHAASRRGMDALIRGTPKNEKSNLTSLVNRSSIAFIQNSKIKQLIHKELKVKFQVI